MVNIESKIVGYKVLNETENNAVADLVLPVIPVARVMNELIKREGELVGITYKIKPPTEDHAVYVTLNSQEVDGVAYPMEIFFNTKNPAHKMWMDALALVISAVFRKGNNVAFLVDELTSVYSASGYWGKDKRTGKGKYYSSLIAEIGEVIGVYLEALSGVKRVEEMPEYAETVIEPETSADGEFPPHATVCLKCNAKAVVLLDGCLCCLSCGDSKCS